MHHLQNIYYWYYQLSPYIMVSEIMILWQYKAKFCLFLVKHQAMHTDRRLNIELHAFFTLALNGHVQALLILVILLLGNEALVCIR